MRRSVLGLAAALASCNNSGPPEGWTTVERDDLVLGVDVTGTLKSEDSDLLGPPQIPDKWDFKIAQMAPEGAKVKEGEVVLAFDFTDLRQELERKQNESDATGKELEKRRADAAMARRDQELSTAEAEGQLRKATLKVDSPDDLVGALELKEARIDLEIAKEMVAYQKARKKGSRRQAQYDIVYLRDKYERTEARVGEIKKNMMQMMVRAPRSGTAIYVTDWRGEKKKVGDSTWRAGKVLEIVSLEKMMATGDVDEVDASKIAVGQKVTFHLDAHQDVEFTGEIRSIVKTVQRQSWRTPLKVVRVEITLADIDTEKMRPGMRLRGTIETGRVEDLLLIPAEAVFVSDDGPVAYRRTDDGYETVLLELGQRNKSQIEVLGGLAEGDTVSRSDLARAVR